MKPTILVLFPLLFAQAATEDPNYRALRDGKLAESFVTENIVLTRDAGKLTLRSGEICFGAPVLGKSAVAMFVGQGRFQLKPALPAETERLQFTNHLRELDEEFDAALLVFTDDAGAQIRGQLGKSGPVSSKCESEFHKMRSQLRSRIQEPRSMMEAELFAESIPNIDAQILADLYNPAQPGSFMAFLHGRKYPNLRFLVRPEGAIPSFGPEEVAVINVSPGGEGDGAWYMTHTMPEIEAKTASAAEDNRRIAVEHYTMDVRVGKHDRLKAQTSVRFRALRAGDRVVFFSLLPNLRVSSATVGGNDAAYIQEGAKQDGSLAVVLPEAMKKDEKYTLELAYEGDKVIRNEGNGNFSVGARESWYPSVVAFRDRATYDITFHVPKQFTLVSVGKKIGEKRDGGELVTEWKSEQPLAVAGFNYGLFKKKERRDEATQSDLEVYATTELPDSLRGADTSAMTPSAMAERVLTDAQNSYRLFTQWFGPLPFGRLAVTQQPAFNFGQSWPTLVYLPVSAFLDPTQRWMLLGSNTFGFSKEFIDVVTAHEVSHQWWGHMVGWSSYHDQWLSEGIADFSASLFLQATQPNSDSYVKFWESERKMILDKNEFGNRANDVGPLWMGLRLSSAKAESAYQRVTYAKGAYIVQMLRTLMTDRNTGDRPFAEMMHEFVMTYAGQCVSTEEFQKMVERHMTPDMNLDGNGKMDWFFREWVYGTEVPSYRLEYTLSDGEQGKTLLTVKVSQQDVSPSFKMRVPLYVAFDGKPQRMGDVLLIGSSTTNEIKVPLARRPKRVLLNANGDVLASSITQK